MTAEITTLRSTFSQFEPAPPIAIKPGANQWLVQWTGTEKTRLAGSYPIDETQVADEVVQWIRVAGFGSDWQPAWQLIATGANEWRIGSFRPIRIEVFDKQPELAPGEEIATPLTAAKVDAPKWWARVTFWAREGSPVMVPWVLATDSVRQGPESYRGVLHRAMAPTELSDPGEDSWGAAQLGRATAAATGAVADAAVKILPGGDFWLRAAGTALVTWVLWRALNRFVDKVGG